MFPTRLLIVVMLTALTMASPLHHPVKRESQNLHIVEVPSDHLESSDHSALSHHFDQQSSHDHLDQKSHHSLRQFHGHHIDQPSSHGHSEQPSTQNHLSQTHHQNPQGPLNSISDQNNINPQSKLEKGRKGPKKGRKSNEDLLHHIGMTKLRSPAVNHHRKRLASQSRKTHSQKSSSDSKMFVIKLPPNPYYYAHHNLKGYDVVEPQQNSVNKVPVNFNTNGKPSRVYHWNIPVLKKMVARKAGSAGKSAILADSEIFNIDKQATWNETDDEKAVYRKAVFYGPKKQSKHTFRKYFAGNGKPHSFYVMEKNKSPSVYRLMP